MTRYWALRCFVEVFSSQVDGSTTGKAVSVEVRRLEPAGLVKIDELDENFDVDKVL